MRIGQRQIYEGERIPAWYGVSCVDHVRAEAVYHLVPINLLVRAWRWLQMSFVFYCNQRIWDAKLKEARDAGYANGFAASQSQPISDSLIQDEVNKRLQRSIELMRQKDSKEDKLGPREDWSYVKNIGLHEGYIT